MIQHFESAEQVAEACDRVLNMAPSKYPTDLPSKQELLGNNDWYKFEHDAWEIGESIRHAFIKFPQLKKNPQVLDEIVTVVLCKNLRRGRETFVLLLGFVGANKYSQMVASLLSDKDVNGHALDTLIKMKADGYATDVLPLLEARHA